jgi:hypothetical protein
MMPPRVLPQSANARGFSDWRAIPWARIKVRESWVSRVTRGMPVTAHELFTYKFFDTTGGERKLFGIVHAADMIGALQRAGSLPAPHHTISRVEVERAGRSHGGLGHLSRAAELLSSLVERTMPDNESALRIYSPAHPITKDD